jgi:hypothetical protein
MNQAERERAIGYLEQTKAVYLKETSGLTEAQWRFKPAPESWSVAECAEHIAVLEDVIFARIQGMADLPMAPAEELAQIAGKEDLMVRMVTSRSRKVQAPEAVRPTNRWPTAELLVEHFTQSRDHAIAFVSSADGLRNRTHPHFILGPLDGYQWLLFLAAHSDRHLKQIAEVKATPEYPK